MTILFLILIILASVILGLIILIQNPKGGGLAGSLSGFNTQFMGVKQTNDVLEKGTWIFIIVIGILSILSPMIIKNTGGGSTSLDKIAPNTEAPTPTTPLNTVPFPQGGTGTPKEAPATSN